MFHCKFNNCEAVLQYKDLSDHLIKTHNFLKTPAEVQCPKTDCPNMYGTIKSLLRHIREKHRKEQEQPSFVESFEPPLRPGEDKVEAEKKDEQLKQKPEEILKAKIKDTFAKLRRTGATQKQCDTVCQSVENILVSARFICHGRPKLE